MDAKELRISNRILRHDPSGLIEDEVTGIFHELSTSPQKEFDVYIQAKNNLDYPIEEIDPIPLTEEWLLKMGFEWDIFYQGYTDGNWVINNNHEGGFRLSYGKRRHDVIIWTIQYVHQLQNLYFALTGEELEVK